MAEVTQGPIEKEGKIALVRYMPLERHIKVGEKMYDFIPKGGVSLSWVDKESIEAVMAHTETCCGGHVRRVFQYANSAQASYWDSFA